MGFKSAAIFLSSVILVGCSTIADYDTAKRLLDKGDTTAATEQLLVLANKGFPDSQLTLANFYAEQPTLEAKNEALQWYAKARLNNNASAKTKAKIDYNYAKFIIENNPVLNSQHKRIIEQSLTDAYKQGTKSAIKLLSRIYVRNIHSQQWDPKGLQLILDDLKQDHNTDELALAQIRLWAAQNKVTQNEKQINSMCLELVKDITNCYKEIYRDRDYIQFIFNDEEKLNRFADYIIGMHQQGKIKTKIIEKVGYDLTRIEEPKLAQAKRLLTEASRSSIEAVLKLIHLSNKIPGFIEYSETEALLKPYRKAEPLNAKYADAVIAYNGELTDQDPWLAEKYFQEVVSQGNDKEFVSKSHYFLGNIYMRGLSGNNDIKLAYDNWLQAGREKLPKGYFQIGKMFFNGLNVKHDKAIAYGFMKLARLDGYTHADKIIPDVEKSLSLNDEIRADEIIAAELNIRGYPLMGDLDLDDFDNRNTALQGIEPENTNADTKLNQKTEDADGKLETIRAKNP